MSAFANGLLKSNQYLLRDRHIRMYSTSDIYLRPSGNFDFLNTVVKSVFSFGPLFNLMKIGARQSLITTAENDGIPWTAMETHLKNKENMLKSYYSETEDRFLKYPEYYMQQYHGYEQGNMNWKAAFECEAASDVIAVRTFGSGNLGVANLSDKLRLSFTDFIQSYSSMYRNRIFDSIADIGCSVGISTFYLARAFPSVEKLDAYDLSPYFLAVAKYRQNVVLDESFIAQEDRQLLWPHLSNFPVSSISKIRWLHSNAENMRDTASESYDLTMLSFILHELPQVGALQDST